MRHHAIGLMVFLVIAFCSPVHSADEVTEYTFGIGNALRYKAIETSHTRSQISAKGTIVDVVTDCEAMFTLVLEPRARIGASTVFSLRCEAPKVQWIIHVGTNICNLSVTDSLTVEGSVNSGPTGQNEGAFRDVAALYVTGVVTVASSGKIADISGSEEFRDYWGRWERLFPLVFPSGTVPVGRTWMWRFTHPSIKEMNLPLDAWEEITTERKNDRFFDGRLCSVFKIASHLTGPSSSSEIAFRGSSSGQLTSPQTSMEGAVLFDMDRRVVFQSITKHRSELGADYLPSMAKTICDRTIKMFLLDQ